MKILLVQNSSYYPTKGGADKSNKILLESLTKRGHKCFVLATIYNENQDNAFEEYKSFLENLEVSNIQEYNDYLSFELNNIQINTVGKASVLISYLDKFIKDIDPDFVLLSTYDFTQVLLEYSVKVDPSRIIYLARTTHSLPFGDGAYLCLPQKVQFFKKLRGIMCVSNFIKDYIFKWTGVEAQTLPISLYGDGSAFPKLGSFDNEYVLMINPSAYKGITIFIELAKKLPEVRFAAVPTWGTTIEDINELKKYENITILELVEDIDILYRKTKVLLVPSLWAEAKSRSIGEALLRGIPVIASDSGGNKEGLNGLDYLLPVKPITKYLEKLDSNNMAMAEVPEQDIEPWYNALKRLVTDKKHYEELSEKSYVSSFNNLVKNNGVEKVENYLMNLKNSNYEKKENINAEKGTILNVEKEQRRNLLNGLTEEQKIILLNKIRNRC
jgi:glycosyltransferase involved in cell wall biosynthesis